jgi:hypothetical protein
LTPGQTVRVFPVGKPECAACGVLRLFARSRKAAAVDFADAPGFLYETLERGGLETSNGRVSLLLTRERVPGPWVDIASGLKYEVQGVIAASGAGQLME